MRGLLGSVLGLAVMSAGYAVGQPDRYRRDDDFDDTPRRRYPQFEERDIVFTMTEKPLGKRARRRQRGRAKAASKA